MKMAITSIESSLKQSLSLVGGDLKISSVQILAFTAGIVLLSRLIQRWFFSTRREHGLPLPPGSLGLPFIGETLDYLRARRRNKSWEFIDSRVAKYGEIFKTNLLGHPTVIIANPAGNRMVYTNENKLFHVSWPESVLDVLGRHSLISLKGDEANKMRLAMATFLGPEALQVYTRKADESVRKFLEEYWDGKERVTVFPLMNRFTFSLACELFMSRYDKHEQQILEKPFKTMMKGVLQLPINLPGTHYRKAMAASELLRNHIKEWLDERRKDLEHGKAAPDQDLMSCLLVFKDEDGQPLTERDILDNILLMLFASHDTSTALITMVCKLLAENPTVFEDVWNEQNEVAAGKKPQDPLSWADLQRMKLSCRVVRETMRLHNPVQGSFRAAINEFEYGGFKIPKAWKIFWSVQSTHRNPKYFTDPDKFDPSRFGGSGPPPYTFVPFGAGPRMCPGNEFARMQALVVMHHLCIRFKWKLVHPDEPIIVDPMPYPKEGLPVWLERRP